MTYKKFKESMTSVEGVTSKQINRFVAQIALFCIFISATLILVTSAMLPMNLTAVVGVFCGLMFLFLLDYASSAQEVAVKLLGRAKFWWISVVLFILVFVVLKVFYFI